MHLQNINLSNKKGLRSPDLKGIVMNFRITIPSAGIIRVLRATILISVFLIVGSAFGQADHVVISEIYGGGGNSGSTYKNDFIELYNPTSSPVTLDGWSVQYTSSTGSTWQVSNINGTIAPHRFFLVQEAAGSGGSVDLPTPDADGSLAMSSTKGKVALVNSTTALSGTGPTGSTIVDLVGFGSANGYEGSGPAPAPSNSTSIERKANSNSSISSMGTGGADELEGNGYDSNDNANDFIVRSDPQPQNSGSPAEPAINNGGSGTGTANISPLFVNAAETTSVTIALAGDGTHTLDSVIVVVPASLGWTWSKNVSDITLSGNAASSPSIFVKADTVFIGSVAITSTDSLKIKISNLRAPDASVNSVFNVKTGVPGIAPFDLSTLPDIQVIKAVPIVQLHVNDSYGVPVSPYAIGTSVTVSGIITADYNSSSTDIYVQDQTAGIDIYSSSRYLDYKIGDSVTVTGKITQFRGLTEISPDPSLLIIHSHGNKVPEPMVLTADEVNQTFHSDDYTEPNEGRLVRLNGVTYSASEGTVTDATGTTTAYIGSIPAPSGTFDLIGILKQYKPGSPATSPYTGDYEVNPRSQDDIIVSAGPSYKTRPVEENILPKSVTILFKTAQASQAVVKFGKTNSYTDSVVVTSEDTLHEVVISGLWPATVYHYQVGAKDAEGTNYTGDGIFSTASPEGSSGTMNVIFNHSVDNSVSTGEDAQVGDISQEYLKRINDSQYSIDLAMYSLSGTVGANIAKALIAAKDRGVKVRVIGEYDNHGTAPWSTLINSGIPVIFDNYDAVNGGAGLTHNKFGVFDYRDTSSFTDDWIWSGSWNATDPGNNNDAQNIIEIQDKALANAYTIEFNEMWGSDTDTPNKANSRFGIRKSDNTPHRFIVNSTPIQLYFDPSDNTTTHIAEALNASVSSINIAMLTFTRSDLAQILVNKKEAGEKVHVLLDNKSDTGNQFSFLQNNGVDILLKEAMLPDICIINML